jgi:hypothetical protein
MSEENKDLTKELHAFRVQDWWGKHNMSSRILAVCIAIVMIAFTVAFFMGVAIPADVLVASIWASASVVIILTIGANSLDSIADIISKIKGFR